jgi:hypothetical protein
MHVSRARDFQEWTWSVPLTGSQNVLVPVASESGSQTVANVVSMPFLRFGAYFHRNTNLIFEVSMNNTNWIVISTLAVVGGTWADAYSMGAPWHSTGYWMIPWALFRIRLVDTSLLDHTYSRFQAIAYTN